MKRDDATNLLDVVGQSANAVAAFTGIKQQFVDAGWNESNAERMVYAMLMQNTGGAR